MKAPDLARKLQKEDWSPKILARILIVDDDKLIRWSLRELFSQGGHTVEAFASAEETLAKVRSEAFDLIIADLEINEENGIEMLKKIRNLQPGTRMIILTAHNPKKVDSLLGNFSVDGVIEKPFRGDQIKALASKILGS